MTRKNKKALFKLSPIACALALSFAFGAAPAVLLMNEKVHSVVPRKLAILIARGIGTRPTGAIFLYNCPIM